ncbi:hypothetical protein MT418_006003 [Batrachochytrium dendrobatidis]
MTRTKRTSGFSINDRRSGENAYMDVKKNGAGRGNWGKALDQTAIDEACYRASMPGFDTNQSRKIQVQAASGKMPMV